MVNRLVSALTVLLYTEADASGVCFTPGVGVVDGGCLPKEKNVSLLSSQVTDWVFFCLFGGFFPVAFSSGLVRTWSGWRGGR